MVFKFFKENYLIFLISILTYLVFFYKLLSPENIIYSGKDSVAFSYSSKIYLAEVLKTHNFPFWSERLFLGFPIYGDLERGYLNPVNIFLIILFGPLTSYKIMHFGCYLLGSISLCFFLKKYAKSNWGFLAANSIYFFSFFPLYHQQHFSMLLTYYLFPLGLLLLDKLINSSKLRYALLNSLLLAFCFYLGSFQFILIFVLIETVYLASLIGLTKKLFFYLAYTFLLFLILTLPGLFSTYNLYVSSYRSAGLNFTQGSFSPLMTLSMVFPFIFNFGDAYMGPIISRNYYIHESYLYFGISSLIFGLLGYIKLRDTKLKRFINILVGAFLVLGFIKYVPIFGVINFLPFSLFRYWGRSIVLINLVFSILVYVFIATKNKITFPKILFIPLLYLFMLQLYEIYALGFKKIEGLKIISLFFRDDYIFGYWYLLWFVFLLVSVICVFIKKLQKPWFISLLITLDIFTFGLLATQDSLIKSVHILDVEKNTIPENTRILDLSNNKNWELSLLDSSWGIFGYSVLYPKSVDELTFNLGFDDIRYPDLQQNVTQNSLNLYKIRSLGIKNIIFSDGENIRLSKNNYLVANDFISNYYHEEGYVSFETNFTIDTPIKTYIRNYLGWDVLIDGKKSLYDSSGLFIKVVAPKGGHKIELKYVPVDLYNGIKICIGMLTIFTLGTIYSVKKFGNKI